jgi:phosphoglycolate phosphatase-like HAD superfamily hydrolase
MPKIRAVLFDLDNTLMDFVQMKEEACKAAAKAMINAGLIMDEKDAYSCIMQKYYQVGLESDIALTTFLKEANQFDHKILAAGINAYLQTKTNFVKPYSNIDTVLKELNSKGLVLGIVTDAPKTKAYQRILFMNIDHHFKFVVGYEDTDNSEQTGLPIQLALNMLRKTIPDIQTQEIVMVGDSIARDVNPAKKLGLKTALAMYGQKHLK